MKEIKLGDRCEYWDGVGWRDSYDGDETYYLCQLPEKPEGLKMEILYKYIIIDSTGYIKAVKNVRPYSSNSHIKILEDKWRDLAKQQEELADEIAKLKGEIE